MLMNQESEHCTYCTVMMIDDVAKKGFLSNINDDLHIIMG